MNSDYGPPRPGWYGGPWRSNSPDPSIRVSDAERAQMADVLSKHYADGRLDETEFKVRLDKAMGAKTRSDLNGLLYDLPPLNPVVHHRRPGIARRTIWLLSVIVLVMIGLGIASALTTPHIPWILIVVVVAVLYSRRHHRWHHHHHHSSDMAA